MRRHSASAVPPLNQAGIDRIARYGPIVYRMAVSAVTDIVSSFYAYPMLT